MRGRFAEARKTNRGRAVKNAAGTAIVRVGGAVTPPGEAMVAVVGSSVVPP
jgi:hypothetical protein